MCRAGLCVGSGMCVGLDYVWVGVGSCEVCGYVGRGGCVGVDVGDLLVLVCIWVYRFMRLRVWCEGVCECCLCRCMCVIECILILNCIRCIILVDK